MDPLTLFAAIAPLAVEAGKAAISRWIAPDVFKPSTIEQYTALRNLDLEMFKAINAAGNAGPSYPWVEASVKLMRPFVAVIVLATWAWSHGFLGAPAIADPSSIDNFASAIGFYLFGDRTLFYAKKFK